MNPNPSLNPTQASFTKWLAEKNNEPLVSVRKRMRQSIASMPNGHGGNAFRSFCNLNYQVFAPFYDDNQRNLAKSYEFYGEMHFLRMLSYDLPSRKHLLTIARLLPDVRNIRILDYGCGLAQLSKALASHLVKRGKNIHLLLADLPTCREAFLRWDACFQAYHTQFLKCSAERPPGRLPKCDLIVAMEFLEHVYAPGRFFDAFDRSLKRGGVLVTNVGPHNEEFMHVSPDLSSINKRMLNIGYLQHDYFVWQKPA